MAKTFDLVQKKAVALVSRKLGECALQRDAQRRMRSGRARLRPACFGGIVVCDFFFAQPASPRVVAGVDQDAVGPGDKTRLTAKAGDAALHLPQGFLDGVFSA